MQSKTYKREVAFLSLIFWAGITARLFVWATPEQINALTGAYSIMTPTILTFVTLAFGIDTVMAGRPNVESTMEPEARKVPGMDRRTRAVTTPAVPNSPPAYE